MSEAQNKALFRSYVDAVIGERNVENCVDYIAADFLDHSNPPGIPTGPEGVKIVMQGFFDAFPDFQVTLEDLMAEGDNIVARASFKGTHHGDYMGIPATGKYFETSGVEVIRVAEGKFVERWIWLVVYQS